MDVSVVVVTRDDPRIVACVRSVLDQRTDFGFDVVVVDGDSRDGSRQALETQFSGEPRLRVVVDPAPFMKAWNAGARRSNGSIIVRIDSDMVAEPGWLQALVDPLRDEPEMGWTAGMVLGPDPAASVTQRYFTARTVAFLKRLDEHDGLERVPSWNVAYRRTALDDVGWFDGTLASSEDWDLHRRLVSGGYPGRFVAQAAARHHHPARLRTLARKEYWYKIGQFQLGLKHGFRTMLPALVLPTTYLGLAALLIGGVFWRPLLWAGLGLWGLVAFIHVVSAVRERDPTFILRPLFRLVEAMAGMTGLFMGLVRYGLPSRPHGHP